MMLSIRCALFALIVLMSCAAVRAARAMRSGPGTEAQATRADLSTEAQATNTGRPSGRKPKPPLPPLRKVGLRKTAARAVREWRVESGEFRQLKLRPRRLARARFEPAWFSPLATCHSPLATRRSPTGDRWARLELGSSC